MHGRFVASENSSKNRIASAATLDYAERMRGRTGPLIHFTSRGRASPTLMWRGGCYGQSLRANVEIVASVDRRSWPRRMGVGDGQS